MNWATVQHRLWLGQLCKHCSNTPWTSVLLLSRAKQGFMELHYYDIRTIFNTLSFLSRTLLFVTFHCKCTFGIPETYYYTRPCTNPQVCYVRYHTYKSCRHFQPTSDMPWSGTTVPVASVRTFVRDCNVGYKISTLSDKTGNIICRDWCESWYEYIQFLIRQQY